MKTRIIVLTLVTSIFFLAAFPAAAQVEPPPPPPPPDEVVASKDLEQNPSSQVELTDVKWELLKDGSEVLTVTGEGAIDKPMFTYELTVDLNSETYKTVIVDNPDVDTLDNAEGALSPKKVNLLQVSPGIYMAVVMVRSWDPVDLELARTSNYLRWQVNSNGSVTWLSGWQDLCTGFTTILNTHWYVSSCTNNPPYYAGAGTRAVNYVKGSYWNQDFLTPLYTYLTHESYLNGFNTGRYNYTYTHQKSGEGAFLIHVTLSSSCSCNGTQ